MNRRRASHRARTKALDRRPLVGVCLAHDEIVLEQFVIVLGVGDRRLQQLAPVTRHLTRGEGEDSACLCNGLASHVSAHHARLARRGAHVACVRPHDSASRRALGATPGRDRARLFCSRRAARRTWPASRLVPPGPARRRRIRLGRGLFDCRLFRGRAFFAAGFASASGVLSASTFASPAGALPRRRAFWRRSVFSSRPVSSDAPARPGSPLPRPYPPRRSSADLPRSGVPAKDSVGANSPSL